METKATASPLPTPLLLSFFTKGYKAYAIANAIINFKIKINDNISIPLFSTAAISFSYLSFNDSMYDSVWTFTGIGVNCYYEKFKLGIFPGYYWGNSGIRNSSNGQTDKKPLDPRSLGQFKIAIIPGLNTSSIKYIDNVIKNIFGYIGLGNPVEVLTSENDNTIYSNIANLLNIAINLTFNQIKTNGNFSIQPNFSYKRLHYDAVAKNDIFEFSLIPSFSINPYSFNISLPIEFGYRNFYSVTNGFQSYYSNTMFIGIGILFTMKDINLLFSYDYDKIQKLICHFVFDIGNRFTLNSSFGGLTYATKDFDFQGYGLRYRYVR